MYTKYFTIINPQILFLHRSLFPKLRYKLKQWRHIIFFYSTSLIDNYFAHLFARLVLNIFTVLINTRFFNCYRLLYIIPQRSTSNAWVSDLDYYIIYYSSVHTRTEPHYEHRAALCAPRRTMRTHWDALYRRKGSEKRRRSVIHRLSFLNRKTS